MVRAYVGDRTNRRHKPGRALERTDYRFDVLSDYGAFRDLQRHRMLTIEWQPLDARPRLRRARRRRRRRARPSAYEDAMDRSAALYDALRRAVPGPGRLRRRAGVQGPLRDAVQRPRGHAHARAAHRARRATPATGAVCQEMHRLIAEQAGHRALAEVMRFVDHDTYDLERLEAERRSEARRAGR